jgi:hypothetical protein
MSSIKLAFGLAVVVCLLAVGASSAMAAQWGQCQTEKEGKFANSECKGTGKGWEWKQLQVKEAVESKGTLTLADTKGGIFGEEVKIECSGFGEGTVGPGTEGEITNITAEKGGTNKTIKCKTLAGICPSPELESRNLPWETELVQTEKEIRAYAHAHPKGGLPGLIVNCSGTQDECVEGHASAKISNAKNGQEVEAERDARSGLQNCTRGGAGSGIIVGVISVKQKNGHALRVK